MKENRRMDTKNYLPVHSSVIDRDGISHLARLQHTAGTLRGHMKIPCPLQEHHRPGMAKKQQVYRENQITASQ